MIVPVMAILNLVLTQQIYSEETNGAHAHYREPVPLKIKNKFLKKKYELTIIYLNEPTWNKYFSREVFFVYSLSMHFKIIMNKLIS